MTAPMATVWGRYQITAGNHPDGLAVVDQQHRALTHRQLLERATALSAGLQERGLQPGQHLGVFMPNRTVWPVLALAAAHGGFGVLGLNTRFRRSELNHLLAVAEVELLVTPDRFLNIDCIALMSELDRPVELIVLSSVTDEDDLLATEPSSPSGSETAADSPLIGFTTSGTTGFPKVAMHNQAQTVAHLEAVVSAFDLDHTSVTLAPLPLCGTFGYTAAMATILAGGTAVVHETWSPDAAATAIAEQGVTFFSASDDMIIDVVGSDHFDPRTTWSGGGFADFTNSGAAAVRAAHEVGQPEGVIRLTGLYGSSEGFAFMSRWPAAASVVERTRNGGYLIDPSMAVRCRDPETGRPLGPGNPGELQFAGPNLIESYLNNPEATAKAFTEDGWYRSGDLGHVIEPDDRGHDGFVYLARLGDSLRLRGFLCDPAEIERHLEAHPGVELAQVVGVDHRGRGDVAVAFVRPTSDDPESGPAGSQLEAELLDHCRTGLANYKRPERIAIVESFPTTDGPNGVKIRKVELRERAQAMLDADRTQ